MKDLKVFIVVCHGTDKDGDSYDETIDRVFVTEDQACEHLMKMKRDWLEENKCTAPVMLTDKFNEFSLYINPDDPLEYAGHVKEISLVGLDKLSDKERFNFASVLFQDPFDGARYAIRLELDVFIPEREDVLTDKQIDQLVSIGIELYKQYDYATPTGVGCAIAQYLMSKYSKDKPLNYDAITYEDLSYAYEVSDWR